MERSISGLLLRDKNIGAEEKMDTERIKENEVRRCTYCRAKENEIRKVGNFVVELMALDINGVRKFACQSCRIKVREARESIQKNIGL